METIRTMIDQYIRHGGSAQYATVGGEHGVLFTNDAAQFVPWSAIGYSQELGFFDSRQFPAESTTAAPPQYTIHPVSGAGGWQAVALIDEGGHGYLIGETWQAWELYHALGAFLHRHEAATPLDEDAEELGHQWLTVAEAVQLAHEHNAAKYPLTNATAETIRRAAQRGKIKYSKGPGGRYKFHAARFRGWLLRE